MQNILGDVLSCALGYILGTLFLALDLWWLSLVWVAVSEVTKFHEISLAALVTIDPLIAGQVACLAYMRDSLVTALAAVLVHSDRLKSWQVAKLYCTVLYCTVLYRGRWPSCRGARPRAGSPASSAHTPRRARGRSRLVPARARGTSCSTTTTFTMPPSSHLLHFGWAN